MHIFCPPSASCPTLYSALCFLLHNTTFCGLPTASCWSSPRSSQQVSVHNYCSLAITHVPLLPGCAETPSRFADRKKKLRHTSVWTTWINEFYWCSTLTLLRLLIMNTDCCYFAIIPAFLSSLLCGLCSQLNFLQILCIFIYCLLLLQLMHQNTTSTLEVMFSKNWMTSGPRKKHKNWLQYRIGIHPCIHFLLTAI